MTSAREHGFYYLAFVDMMGQRSALCDYEDLPVGSKDLAMANLQTDLQIEDLKQFRKIFFDFKDHFNASLSARFSTAEQNEMVDTVRQCPMEFHCLSDGICIYGRVDGQNDFGMVSIYQCFQALSATLNLFLAMQKPFRGAMCIAPACLWGKDEIYGPALNLAYRLESKECGWPRILLHDSVERFLKGYPLNENSNYKERVQGFFARQALEYITSKDNVDFLDHAGIKFRETAPDAQIHILKNAVISAMNYAKNPDLTRVDPLSLVKVRGYYKSTLQYLQSKGEIWGF